jgi:leader peptidase (prepilin peptidase)/N-methyltransferase
VANLAVGFLAGAVWGWLADRLAGRWPAHPDGSVRSPDWRTLIVVALSGVGGGLFALRVANAGWGGSWMVLAAAYFLALAVLLATDLDQRLLPDLLTLPMAGVTLVVTAAGLNPLVGGGLVGGGVGFWGALLVAVAVPLGLWAASLPFGPGAIGSGDLKLLVSVGLLCGPWRTLYALLAGAMVMAVVLVALLVLRRISLRSHVPMGPFLIVGTAWAILGPGG